MSVEQKGFESLLRSNEGIAIASILGGLAVVVGGFFKGVMFPRLDSGYLRSAEFYDDVLMTPGHPTRYLPKTMLGVRQVHFDPRFVGDPDLSTIYRFNFHCDIGYPWDPEEYERMEAEERRAIDEIVDYAVKHGFEELDRVAGRITFQRSRCTLHDDCIEHPEIGAACLEDQKKNPDLYVIEPRSKP